jgi:hypothetical protein
MRMKRLAVGGLLLAGVSAFALSQRAEAQDAPFGCKVLLCAAATAPGWNGIPYCIPVMTQLFTSLAKGAGWPSCSAANVGPIQYQPYQACPANTVAVSAAPSGDVRSSASLGSLWIADSNGAFCLDPAAISPSEDCSRSGCVAIPANYTPAPRPVSPQPYMVMIGPSDGSTPQTPFYFSLQGY